MTIKTLKPATSTSSSCSISTQSKNVLSDMPKKGAVRNLFNTAVDRKELNQQMQSMESKNKRALSNFKVDSVIGVINRDDEDQKRRLKYLPIKEKDTRRSSFSTNHTLQSMVLESTSSSSTATTSSSSYKSESSKIISTATKAINHTLPKGQKTIKDYYPTVKRSRQNHR